MNKDKRKKAKGAEAVLEQGATQEKPQTYSNITKDKRKRAKGTEVVLEQANIEEKVQIQESVITNALLFWNVRKYTKLKNNVIYYQTYDSNDFSCVFKLIKTNRMLYLAVRCGLTRGQGMFHLVSPDAWETSTAEEIVEGLYIGEFPQDSVFRPSGGYLKDGQLTTMFRVFRENQLRIVHNSQGCSGQMSDIDELCFDMRTLYLEGTLSDISINARGVVFKAHKDVLCARSEYFRELFRILPSQLNQKVVVFDTFPEIMWEVLLYCYSGELRSMDVKRLTKVLDVANRLNIESLRERCLQELRLDCGKEKTPS